MTRHPEDGVYLACAALFAVFTGLRVCHVIGWSWWWVAMPLWLPAAVVAVLLAVAGVAVLFVNWGE